MAKAVSARRYAQAVFEIALESKELERWQADLHVIAEALGTPRLAAILENPKLQFNQKQRLLQNILVGISPVATNLAYLLVRKKLIRVAGSLVTEYTRLMNAYNGRETAKVISAIHLNSHETEVIRQKLAKLTGKKLVVATQVDSEIMGGLVAKIGDELIDGSVRTRLMELRKDLIEAGLEVK